MIEEYLSEEHDSIESDTSHPMNSVHTKTIIDSIRSKGKFSKLFLFAVQFELATRRIRSIFAREKPIEMLFPIVQSNKHKSQIQVSHF